MSAVPLDIPLVTDPFGMELLVLVAVVGKYSLQGWTELLLPLELTWTVRRHSKTSVDIPAQKKAGAILLEERHFPLAEMVRDP